MSDTIVYVYIVSDISPSEVDIYIYIYIYGPYRIYLWRSDVRYCILSIPASGGEISLSDSMGHTHLWKRDE